MDQNRKKLARRYVVREISVVKMRFALPVQGRTLKTVDHPPRPTEMGCGASANKQADSPTAKSAAKYEDGKVHP